MPKTLGMGGHFIGRVKFCALVVVEGICLGVYLLPMHEVKVPYNSLKPICLHPTITSISHANVIYQNLYFTTVKGGIMSIHTIANMVSYKPLHETCG